MEQKFSLMIEGDEGGFSAYVPELPTILVTGRTLCELLSRAAEAIGIYRDTIERNPSSASTQLEEFDE
ncbi:MAG: hypothetical protein FJW36_22235 [Acidobacteria bacterium]|nr:hypothetical protein [Acidobacteriota bacterium]